jgi:hypothetical protein
VKENHFQLGGTIAVDDMPDVRRIVEKVHLRVMSNRDDIARVIMAAHELLENAVKFSSDGSATLDIEVVGGNEVCITTRNRTNPENIKELRAIRDELGSVADSYTYYLALMHRAPRSSSGGGLGIGRVAAEGEMKIDVELEGDIVQIQARSSLAKP